MNAFPQIKLTPAQAHDRAIHRALTIAAFLAALATATPAYPATLRSEAILTGGDVRLSDLFEDAGPQANRILGPGPAPGGRIVVESAQLGAIARQFGVAWRPSGPSDRAVLERPGRTLPRDLVQSALRSALEETGIQAADTEIDIAAYTPPMLAPEATPEIAVEQFDHDRDSGRFAAVLSISAPGMPQQRLRITGKAVEMADAILAARRLSPGETISAGDLRAGRIRANLVKDGALRRVDQALGMTVRHSIIAGQPVPASELARPVMVARGAIVMMQLETPGLSLSGQAQALDAGGIGERVRVLNPSSRAVLEAEVIGPDRVRVSQNAAPILPPGRAGLPIAAAPPPRAYAQFSDSAIR